MRRIPDYSLGRRAVLRVLFGGCLVGLAGCNDEVPFNSFTPTPTPHHLTKSAKLAPADGNYGDQFGISVALAGDTALIGAWGDEDPNGKEAGSAYIFEQTGGEWRETAKLAPADGDWDDHFGGPVALAENANTALISAWGDEEPNGDNAGSVYVFELTGGKWRKAAKLVPADGDRNDHFGGSVALAGDGRTALIGAWGDEDPNGKEAGAAYVFDRTGGEWREAAKLSPADGERDDHFGGSVTLAEDADTAIIATSNDEGPNGDDMGSAYVFKRTNSEWRETDKLTPGDGDKENHFGESVALAEDADTALIGAGDVNGFATDQKGSAYVFERAGGEWSETANFTAHDEEEGDDFGQSVALAEDANTALIGAWGDEDDTGAAYVFERTGGEWHEVAKLIPTPDDVGNYFGGSAALAEDGETALIGAWADEHPNGSYAGSASVFDLREIP